MVAGDKLLGLLARARRWRNGHSAYPSRRLVPGPLSPAPSVPPDIARPPYAAVANAAANAAAHPARAPSVGGAPELFAGDPQGLERMRRAGALVAAALSLAGRMIETWGSGGAGDGATGSGESARSSAAAKAAAAPPAPLTTDAVDRAVHAFLIANGAYPSPLGYHGFPRSVCVAVNECAAHGVPDGGPLRGGDLVSVDVSAFCGGVHGDTCATFFVGGGGGDGGGGESARHAPSPAARELVEAAREALYAAIAACGPGAPFSEVGAAVQRTADRAGVSVVRGLVGHGVGRVFHAAPAVPHHREWGRRAASRGRMVEGQAFTIEPILALGRGGGTLAAPWRRDGWTLVTGDGSLAAQFEHTLVVGAGGAEVLTRREGERIGGGSV